MASTIPRADLDSFHEHLAKSKRVIALCGAGLSAASGLPTFRGKGGLWRTYEAKSLATPEAWRKDPVLVWQFYNYRRHMSLTAQPNAAHYALAEFARRNPGFQCLSQNVDGLSQRASHPRGQLQLLHGSLFDVKCDQETLCNTASAFDDCGHQSHCSYKAEDFNDPFCSALVQPSSGRSTIPTANAAPSRQSLNEPDLSDIDVPLPAATVSDLPKCPQCGIGTIRPGVVWFGEALSTETLCFIDRFIRSEPVDLIMVIGTSATVYPAAGYIAEARSKNTRVAVINMDENDVPYGGGQHGDWFFVGDAASIVPELLRPVIGDVTRQVF